MANHVESNNSLKLEICPTEPNLSSKCDKRSKKNTLAEIIIFINALLNSGGGTLLLLYDTIPLKDKVKKCRRKIEQKIRDFLGTISLAFAVNLIDVRHIPSSPYKHGGIKILVNPVKTNKLFTIKNNIFLPSSEQVMEVLPSENVEILLVGKKPLEEVTEPGSHHKMFEKNEQVPFSESKTIQFKMLKDERKGETTFTNRLVSKGNKLTCYVSAFANFVGGHVYIGITDDGKVEGERLLEQEREKAKEAIGKVVEKMIWPKKWDPKDGFEDKRWNVHFEPVKDSAENQIPSLYVVVVFVAQCLGGVFTEAPECYEIVNNHEVKKVEFLAWKRSIVGEGLAAKEETRSSGALCDLFYEKLTCLMNDNCKKEELDTANETAQEENKFNEIEVKLTYLSKLILYHLRKGEFYLAEETLKKYNATLPSTTSTEYFEVVKQYVSSVMERCKGNYDKGYDIANKCFEDLQKLPPCIISAAFYVQIATLENILATKAKTREEMKDLLNKAVENYNTAKEQLNNIQKQSATKAEFEQKIFINKALLYLGCSPTGDMLPYSEELIHIKEAEELLEKLHRLTCSKFREIQYLFAKACLSYRSCIFKPSEQAELLKAALLFTKKAENLAEKCKFAEMTTYAKKFINFFESKQHK